jgi:hypothetical protein
MCPGRGQAAGAAAIALFLLALGAFVRRFRAAVGNNDIEFFARGLLVGAVKGQRRCG